MDDGGIVAGIDGPGDTFHRRVGYRQHDSVDTDSGRRHVVETADQVSDPHTTIGKGGGH